MTTTTPRADIPPTAEEPGTPRRGWRWRLLHRWHYTFVGVIGAVTFFCLSLTPSLLPRGIRVAGPAQRDHRGHRLRTGSVAGVAGQQAVHPAAARAASGGLAVAGRPRRGGRGGLRLSGLRLAAGGPPADGYGAAVAARLRPRARDR